MAGRHRRISQAHADRPTRRYGSLRRVQAEAAYLATLSPYYHALRPLRLVLDARCPPVLEYLRKLTAAVAVTVHAAAGTGPRVGEQVRRGARPFRLPHRRRRRDVPPLG